MVGHNTLTLISITYSFEKEKATKQSLVWLHPRDNGTASLSCEGNLMYGKRNEVG